jgi:hypothetical protein
LNVAAVREGENMNQSDAPTPNYVTCPCQHCSGKIEFDANQLDTAENTTVPCPHCGLETILFVPPSPTRPVLPKNITPPPTVKTPPTSLALKNPKSSLEVVSSLSLIGFFVWTGLCALGACWGIFVTFKGMSEDTSAAYGAGATVGLGIWMVVCLVIWLFGAVPAALIWFMTRKR